MKKRLFLFSALLAFVVSANATIREVTLQTDLHCENCVKTIKDKIKFEKGLKKMASDVEQKTITLTYDDKSTSSKVLAEAVRKAGYQATIIEDKIVEKSNKKKK